MTRRIIHTPDVPSPAAIAVDGVPRAPYSQAVAAGGLVFVSGTFPVDPATGRIEAESIQGQTAQCLRNISAILAAAGTSLANAVSATVILANEEDFAGMNEEWVKWFPAEPPARQGAKLPVRVPGMRISIAMIAAAS